MFGPDAADKLSASADIHLTHLSALEEMQNKQRPGSLFVIDLIANAQRRAQQNRFDDAVARLYRATEALAQIRLQQKYHLDTGNLDLTNTQYPQTVKDRWCPQGDPQKIGLQEAYKLLNDLDDPLGQRFSELSLDDKERSPLSARNQSILAHGFSSLTKKTFDPLWKTLLDLTQCTEQDLPRFPRLPPAGGD